ncbi:MAG: cation transporter [Pseudomonadota bacterium]
MPVALQRISGAATVSRFAVPAMDCPAEERLIRMALEGMVQLRGLEFDLAGRELRVFHDGPVDDIDARLNGLGLGARLLGTTAATALPPPPAKASPAQESRVLKWLLGINAVMFLVELVTGWLAQSTGLLADSLDMFADAAVYGLALYAVGRHAGQQIHSARLSGWLQLLLALGALAEVGRRGVMGSAPEAPLMMGIALLALVANVACLALLARHRDGGVHMRASWIFSTNDVLANAGVILAGGLVAVTGSNYPDLAIGALIALLVLNGARRILALKA